MLVHTGNVRDVGHLYQLLAFLAFVLDTGGKPGFLLFFALARHKEVQGFS